MDTSQASKRILKKNTSVIKKKRKVHEEGRIFQEKWELQYFCISQNSKAHCLICHISISTMKEYNISRHQNKHSSQYDKFKDQIRTMKLLELKAQLNCCAFNLLQKAANLLQKNL